jgi:hypothetical protein
MRPQRPHSRCDSGMYARAASCSCAEMASSAPCPVASARAATAGSGFAADTPAARCDDGDTHKGKQLTTNVCDHAAVLTAHEQGEGAPAI